MPRNIQVLAVCKGHLTDRVVSNLALLLPLLHIIHHLSTNPSNAPTVWAPEWAHKSTLQMQETHFGWFSTPILAHEEELSSRLNLQPLKTS